MPKRKEMCTSVSIEPDKGIVMMSISELHDFKGHPFKVERNPELFELRQSIEKEGILIPLLIRKIPMVTVMRLLPDIGERKLPFGQESQNFR